MVSALERLHCGVALELVFCEVTRFSGQTWSPDFLPNYITSSVIFL